MDAKLVNPFIDALVSVLPQMGFEVPQRSGMSVKNQTCKSLAQSALAELSNMLTANAATNLTAMGMEVDISTPSLTVGKDFQIKISNSQYLAVNMDLGGPILELNIAVQ